MTLNFMLIYITTVFIATIIPGPSMLLALTHGIQFGAKRTMASALGNLTVTFIQASISVAGLGSILIASETAFKIIKLAGAAYLISIGFGILFFSKMSIPEKQTDIDKTKVSLKKMYLQGVFVTAGNPKAIVFFTAVFPQFINPNETYFPQFCLMMSIVLFIAFTCFMLYALSGQKIVFMFSNVSFGKYINRIIGATFIGAGIGLASGNQ